MALDNSESVNRSHGGGHRPGYGYAYTACDGSRVSYKEAIYLDLFYSACVEKMGLVIHPGGIVQIKHSSRMVDLYLCSTSHSAEAAFVVAVEKETQRVVALLYDPDPFNPGQGQRNRLKPPSAEMTFI